MKRTLLIVLGVVFAGALGVAGQEPPPAKPLSLEQSEILNVFQSYKSALLQGDGETAARLVDADTLEYFRDIQGLALSADASVLKSRPFVDRLLVITIRHELDTKMLEEMGLEDLLRHAINAGWIAKASILQLDIGEITVVGDEASAVALVNGAAPPPAEGAEPLAYRFVDERGGWRFRFSSLVASLNRVISDFTAQMGAKEDDLIFTLVQAISGRQVLPEVWDTPLDGHP